MTLQGFLLHICRLDSCLVDIISLLFFAILTAMLRYRIFISHIHNDFMIYLFLKDPLIVCIQDRQAFLIGASLRIEEKLEKTKPGPLEKSVKHEKQHSLGQISEPFLARNEFQRKTGLKRDIYSSFLFFLAFINRRRKSMPRHDFFFISVSTSSDEIR